MRKTIAIDLDGTLARYDGWKGVEHIGPPLDGAKAFVQEIREHFDVMIYTTRGNSKLNNEPPSILRRLIELWLEKWTIPFDEIWIGQGKPLCEAIVDDRATTCRPQENPGAYQDALDQIKELCIAEITPKKS